MSLAFKCEDQGAQEYATKTELHRGFQISYAKIADAIREGKLAIHLIDGKIQINVAEARAVLCVRRRPRRPNLFD